MTGPGDMAAVFGIAFGATALIFLTGTGAAALSDWIFERSLRKWRRHLEQNKEKKE